WLPTLRATRVPPLAALAVVPTAAVRRKASVARGVVCGILVLIGVLLTVPVFNANPYGLLWAVLACFFLALGLFFAAPLYLPACLRLLGLAATPFGPTARLAARNAVRNPRRSAATATALMLAISLIVCLQVGVASGRGFVLDFVASRTDLDSEVGELFQQVFDSLLLSATLLMAVAVVIALVGVANTLSLSVIERGRETALLRALGVQKGQLRSMLLTEALLIAVVGVAVGMLAGTLFAWLGVEAIASMLRAEGTVDSYIPLRFDALYTIGLVLAAVAAAALASVLPGRKAANSAPTAALAET
ncbi:MAG: FtsX-like permease family protein, partial [Propionibacteriaceae bacterium]|nr:FtsX-like permease family protein [Propionibacteriaceae bacterium]